MFFTKVKYYNSADNMPIGRYMLAICRDIRYFAKGDELPVKVNHKALKTAVDTFNKSILQNSDQKQLNKELSLLVDDEGKIYMQSALVAIVEYCNQLIDAGADKNLIQQKLKPIQHLLIERGLSPDSKKNKNRLEKIARNFKIKSEEIKNRLRSDNADNNKLYEQYLRNLVIIEKTFGVKINEQTDSVNKYVLLLDEINRHNQN